MKKKQLFLIAISAVLLIGLIIGAVFLWKGSSADPEKGSKAIVFEVVQKDGTSKEHEIATDAEYLADALVEEGLVDYAEDGMYTVIDGIEASWEADKAFWWITVNGEDAGVGLNDLAITDGGHYEATYTISTY
ncbi:MAG: hypothetical protein IJ995_03835 [Clostridia bacterium]|nr:hypothetical protein [Clostridia bacterium]